MQFMFLCCQLNAFSVRLDLELGLKERPPLLCFQEGMSVVGCIAVCSVHPLNPRPDIGTVAATSVVSRPSPHTAL